MSKLRSKRFGLIGVSGLVSGTVEEKSGGEEEKIQKELSRRKKQSTDQANDRSQRGLPKEYERGGGKRTWVEAQYGERRQS